LDDAYLANTSPLIILFSEHNSEAMNDPNNDQFGSIPQDDYDR
jgi:hypothetical protein